MGLTTTQKGYGAKHQALRRQWKVRVDRGEVCCARCGRQILPGDAWDLGHLDGTNKQVYSGPEHRHENRATAAHKAARRRPARRWSRQW